jgi:hypothetical protein
MSQSITANSSKKLLVIEIGSDGPNITAASNHEPAVMSQ